MDTSGKAPSPVKQPPTMLAAIRKISFAHALLIYAVFVFFIFIGIKYNDKSIIYSFATLYILFFIIRIKRYFPINQLAPEADHKRLSFTKTICEIFAFVFAGFYFFYKTFGNLDITELQLKIVPTRICIPKSANDYLSVSIGLTKGPTTSMFIEDIKVYLVPDTATLPSDSILVTGFERLYTERHYATRINQKSHTALFNDIDRTEHYALAATESTEFGAYTTVNRNSVYTIHVVVVGERRKLLHKTYPLFRASVISLPQPCTTAVTSGGAAAGL